ncbi:MAG TPA: signal peptidase I [Candidatus Wirthbacteria bacterium]|nr:signal peptidase I [Candidatus Wirthbacteria bacterium]
MAEILLPDEYFTRIEPEQDSFLIRAVLLILEIIAILLIVFFVLRLFIIEPYTVIGSSMFPTLVQDEEVYVNKISYRIKNPKRGDIVVFVPPVNVGKNYVKRIIGLPGERLQIKGDGQVIIYNDANPQGISLIEDYLPKSFSTQGFVVERLKENEYFVMGDNREASSDSRGNINSDDPLQKTHWTLPRHNIIGKVICRTRPIDKFTFLSLPEYNL